jgi:hypothetical protein
MVMTLTFEGAGAIPDSRIELINACAPRQGVKRLHCTVFVCTNFRSSSLGDMADAPQHPKVALGDTNNMKRLLDEAIIRAVLKSTNLKEDMTYSNFKLGVMIISCAFASLAQFYPMSFPDSRLLLAVCVVVYFGLSGVLQYLTWYGDKDSCMYTLSQVSHS